MLKSTDPNILRMLISIKNQKNMMFFLIFDEKQHPKIFGSVDVKITPDFCS